MEVLQTEDEQRNGNQSESMSTNGKTVGKCTTASPLDHKLTLSGKVFDFQLVCDAFVRSIDNKDAISLEAYLQGYTELNKFFNLFGKLFIFVTKDVHEKITILQTYASHEEHGVHYTSVQSMIAFERSADLLHHPKRPSGARTLLRLHRALQFIAQFLAEVAQVTDQTSTVPVVRQAYERTLAQHHPWVVRKAVQVATMALPYKHVLVERIYGGREHVPQGPEVNETIRRMAQIAEQVFELTNQLFQEHSLLDLP